MTNKWSDNEGRGYVTSLGVLMALVIGGAIVLQLFGCGLPQDELDGWWREVTQAEGDDWVEWDCWQEPGRRDERRWHNQDDCTDWCMAEVGECQWCCDEMAPDEPDNQTFENCISYCGSEGALCGVYHCGASY